jgi:hypothetical protein
LPAAIPPASWLLPLLLLLLLRVISAILAPHELLQPKLIDALPAFT